MSVSCSPVETLNVAEVIPFSYESFTSLETSPRYYDVFITMMFGDIEKDKVIRAVGSESFKEAIITALETEVSCTKFMVEEIETFLRNKISPIGLWLEDGLCSAYKINSIVRLSKLPIKLMVDGACLEENLLVPDVCMPFYDHNYYFVK